MVLKYIAMHLCFSRRTRVLRVVEAVRAWAGIGQILRLTDLIANELYEPTDKYYKSELKRMQIIPANRMANLPSKNP